MTTNDKLREALELIAKTGPDARQCRNIAVAALAASKHEPQAQAEPEVVAEYVEDETYGHRRWKWGKLPTPEVGDKLITLQAHREAMAEITRRFEELKRHGISHHVHNEAIAKKDAALQAGVELMQYMRSVSSFERNGEIDAAITQAEEAQG